MNNIFIIMGNGWNRERVVESLEGEGYDHNFYIGDIQKPNEFQKHMKIAQECWCFGDCTDNIMYKYAKKHGKDLWQMG